MAKRPQKKKRPPELNRVEKAEVTETLSGNSTRVFWTSLVQALVMAAAVLWIYRPALHGGWLWDDETDITDNAITQSPTGLWSIWFEPGSNLDYYPIKASVQWLQWHLWGMDTLGYHLTNVLLHILSALLVWRLLSKFGLRLAWLGGLIFAIHPVQVESVAWIAELKNTLSLPLFLLAMCAYLDYEEHGKSKDYWLALGLFLAAMLCKTTMVMFPVAILLYAWWKRGRIGWHDLKASGPFFVVSLAMGLMTVWCQHHHAREESIPSLGGVFPRLACAGLSLSFYFSKCFLPVELMPVYPQWTVDPPAPWQFLPLLVLGGAIYWLWTKRRGCGRHALLGLGFFLIFLAPFLGFNAISYMDLTWVMDHFLYIPMIGLIGLVVAALGQMEVQLPASFRPCGIGLAMAALALLAFESRNYAKMFVNSETLWTYTLQYNPEAYPAHNNLGLAFLHAGQVSKAMEQFEQAVRIKPSDAEAYNNLGIAYLQSQQVAKALEQYEQAVRIKPDYAEAHYNLGSALFKSGRLSEAINQFELALHIKPGDAEVHDHLGSAYFQEGRFSEAINQFQLALQIKPNDAEAHNNLGYALQQTGHLPEAMEQYEQALRLKPDFAEADYNLGYALQQTGRISEAIKQYELALQINPDYAEAHNNLGGALQQTGRRAEAMEQYEQALRIKPDLVTARDNLARLQALETTVPAKN